jgi:hypothetical protein
MGERRMSKEDVGEGKRPIRPPELNVFGGSEQVGSVYGVSGGGIRCPSSRW